MNSNFSNLRSQRGMTLIELMIAMVLGLLVIAGIGSLFLSTSSSVKALEQLASLQESGRFAIARLSEDIRMTNAQYCSGSGGNARPSGANIVLDDLRAPKVYASGALLLNALSDVTTPWGGAYPAAPSQAYAMPEYLSMRGYDCDATTCNPADPSSAITAIPHQGTAEGDRVVGSDVLTIRYLDSSAGWSIGHPGGSSITSGAGGKVEEIELSPLPGEPAVSEFGANHLAMLSDCSLSQVFAVTGQGSNTLQLSSGGNFDTPSAMTGTQALRLFDFNNSFKTVTYYLKVVRIPNDATTGALIRRVNGVDEEIVRGIERLDFRYGVMDSSGRTQFITANAVENSTNCPWTQPDDSASGATPAAGCLWRAVTSVEINLLASGQVPLQNLTEDELAYSYDDKRPAVIPENHIIKPDSDQGFPEKLMRREFTALVAIRNYNP